MSPATSVKDSGVDFVGVTAEGAVVSGEACVGGVCFGGGALVGTGLALFGKNLLPIGLGDLPLLWDQQSPEVLSLVGGIDGIVTDLTTQVLGKPAVVGILDSVLGSLLDGLALPV